jgi:hypothetical protein
MLPLLTASDFTLADSGNCISRVYGLSPDGLMAGEDSPIWQGPDVPEFTAVRAHLDSPSKVELHLDGSKQLARLLPAVNGEVSGAEKTR